MKTEQLKNVLLSEIESVSNRCKEFSVKPDKHFTRKRKLPFEKIIKTVIGMESKSLTNELIDAFDADAELPSTSAFVQQRCKIKPDAFKTIFDGFTSKIISEASSDIRILAVDGSDIQITTNPDDLSSYHPGANGQKPYNLLHLNALYDLENHIYTDAVIQGRKDSNEHDALQKMVDASGIPKALVIADRGYESYNNMAHIQEKGWYFLIRIKDGVNGIKNGLSLPDSNEFDIDISLKLSRKQTNEMKELYLKEKNHYKLIPHSTPFDFLDTKLRKQDPIHFYELHFRIVRFKISDDLYETVLTNLNSSEYTPDKLKTLYAARWGIETSFRDLKYTIGLLDFHSKKVMCIYQEIYARLIMYNFAEMITSHVAIKKKQRKYTYKANFSIAVHMCRLFYQDKTTSPCWKPSSPKILCPSDPAGIRNVTLRQKFIMASSIE